MKSQFGANKNINLNALQPSLKECIFGLRPILGCRVIGTSPIFSLFFNALIIISGANSIPIHLKSIFSIASLVKPRIPQYISVIFALKTVLKIFVRIGFPIYLCNHGIAPGIIFPFNLVPITKS